MKIRRINCLVLIFVFMITNLALNFRVAKAEENFITPDGIKVTIDKTSAIVGETVNVTIEVIDDIIVTEGMICYSTPSGRFLWSRLDSGNDTMDNTFHYKMNINSYSESGMWRVAQVDLRNNTGGFISVTNSQLEGLYGNVEMDLSGGNFTVSGTTPDTKAPILKKVTVDKASATAGDVVSITIEAEDDISGLVEVMPYIGETRLAYRTPSGADKWVRLELLEGKLKARINIGEFSEAGSWKINSIVLLDKAGNQANIGNSKLTNSWGEIKTDLSGGDFTVIGTTSDIKAPVFKSVAVDKTSAVPGDVINITVEAQDDLSGLVDFVDMIGNTQIRYVSPTGREISINRKIEGGRIIGSFSVNGYTEPGNWKIKCLDLIDKAGNRVTIGNSQLADTFGDIKADLSGGNFTVSGTTPDVKAPIFKSVSVDRNNVVPGSEVKITVEAEEDLSGIAQHVPNLGETRIVYRTSSGIEKWITLNLVEGKLICSINISEFSELGIWRIRFIELLDNAGNRVVVANSQMEDNGGDFKVDLSGGDFTVSGTTPDIKAPTFKSVAVNKTSAVAGDIINITVEAQDDLSGLTDFVDMIGNTQIRYISPTGREISINRKVEGGRIIGSFSVNQYTEPGKWKIKYIHLIDKAGNRITIGNSMLVDNWGDVRTDLGGGDFTVSGTNPDTKAPIFKSVSVDRINATAGTVVNITVDAEEDLSGIAQYVPNLGETRLVYRTPSGIEKWVRLDLVESKLKCSINIGEFSESGIWKIRFIELLDKAGNRSVVANSQMEDIWGDIKVSLSSGDFTVTGTTPDIKAPVFKSIAVDKASAVAGDIINVTVEAEDDISGIVNNVEMIGSTNIGYVSPTGREVWINRRIEGGRIIGSFNVNGYTEPGIWRIKYLQLIDKAGNRVTIGNANLSDNWGEIKADLSGGNFTVSGTTADIEAPILKSIVVDKPNAAVGDKVSIIIDAVDNFSGLAEYVEEKGSSSICVLTPSGREIWTNVKLENGKFIYSMSIGQYSESGEWKIKRLELIDNAGNRTIIGNTGLAEEWVDEMRDLNGGNFRVTGTTSDSEPPQFKSVSIDKAATVAGDVVNITVKAEDSISGITNYVPYIDGSTSLCYLTPSGREKYLELNLGSEELTGILRIGEYTEPGTWKLQYISLIDKAGNRRVVRNSNVPDGWGDIKMDLSGGDFTVTGTTADTEAPVFKSVTVDKISAAAGDKVNITVEAVDNLSGLVQYVPWEGSSEIFYMTPSGKQKWTRAQIIDGKLVGRINIGEYSESGLWKIKTIELVDKAGNRTTIGNTNVADNWGSIKLDLSAGNFTVSGTNPDSEAPLFKAVSVDKSSATVGNIVNINVRAEDNLSGVVSYVPEEGESTVVYVSPSGRERWLSLDVQAGQIKANMNIGQFTEPGTWRVKCINLIDKAGNRVAIGNSQITDNLWEFMMDLSGGNFTVSGTDADTSSPVYNSAAVDMKEAAKGKIVTITIDAIDDKAGLSDIDIPGASVGIEYLSPSHNYIWIKLNLVNGKYIGYFEVDETVELGLWKANFISLLDNAGNKTCFWDTSLNPQEQAGIDLSSANIKVERFCDFNSDNNVTLNDLNILVDSYNSTSSTSGFKDQYDVNGDGIIDIFDIVTVSAQIQ